MEVLIFVSLRSGLMEDAARARSPQSTSGCREERLADAGKRARDGGSSIFQLMHGKEAEIGVGSFPV